MTYLQNLGLAEADRRLPDEGQQQKEYGNHRQHIDKGFKHPVGFGQGSQKGER